MNFSSLIVVSAHWAGIIWSVLTSKIQTSALNNWQWPQYESCVSESLVSLWKILYVYMDCAVDSL